jgi:prepilin-type N-terminal cleavage/methylation domain-containing protein
MGGYVVHAQTICIRLPCLLITMVSKPTMNKKHVHPDILFVMHGEKNRVKEFYFFYHSVMIKRGVTLLELLVVIVVVGIVFTMIFRVYGAIITNTNRVNQIVLMQTASQDLYLHLTLLLHRARFDPERHSPSLLS